MNPAILDRLRDEHKLSLYLARVAGEKPATEEEKEEIALRVLNAPLPWAMGFGLEFNARRYPPDCEDD